MRRALTFYAVMMMATTATRVVLSGAPGAATNGVTKSASPIGRATKLTINAGSQGVVKFMGLTGQVVSVATSAGTFANNTDLLLSVQKPDQTTIAGPVAGGQAGTIAGITLPGPNGLYRVFLDPQVT